MNGNKVMLIDLNSCGGCHACSVSCKAEHRAPLEHYRHRVQVAEAGVFPHVKRAFIPALCQHCTDAPCIQACPVGAISRKTDGAVIIDHDMCVGSGTCVSACPYGAIYMDPETQLASKCDFCQDRQSEGQEPACVSTCPTEAIRFGNEDDPEIAQRLKMGTYTTWEPKKSTKPLVLYQGLDETMQQALTRINAQKGGV
ncbi:4Fe-4S dicluster domain-containing protein [Neobacillus muris]|uniref:4Fe-4S dicluster domain-containing protein n=1 Tax=Neobacillus muris TaxID=2941334 RepID=UPI00203E28CF|nr:4Fe-4S dicluster domain-containing protein [Neobacillus muris]